MLIENLEFLRDYLLAPPHQFDVELQSKMRDLLSERRWCSIATIIDKIPGIADTLYMAIVQGRVVFDITASPISDVARAMVFRDSHCAALYGTFARSQTNEPRQEIVLSLTPGAKFDWDGAAWEVINVGHAGIYCRCLASHPEPHLGFITLTHEIVDSLAREGKLSPYGIPKSNSSEDEALQRLQRASDDKQLEALERYKCLFDAGYDGRLISTKKRTRQYWLARFREADASFGIGLLGLLPNWNNTQGNHERKVAKPVLSIMETVIQSDWPDPRQRTTTALYGKTISMCEASGLRPPSRTTFRREIVRLKTGAAITQRYGSRIAYELEPIPTIPDGCLTYHTARHGTHPFHIGHLDHTPLPLRVLSSDGSRVLKSVWFTLLICAYTRKALAFYLTFDPPSYRSNMMVIRDCVRRHGRVPQFIVVDNGKDFQSTYFDRLLAALRVHKINRRPSQPRDGNLIESLFNVTQGAFIYNLLGNTQADREYRKKTKAVDPERLAIWTLSRLAKRLEQYFDEVYHNNYHSTLGCSPAEMFARGLVISGPRSHARIPYSKAFLMLTFPSTSKGTAKVTTRGVKVNYCYYSCAVLTGHRNVGKQVPVRYDPFDMGVAYVYVDHLWHECRSEHYLSFKGRSERETQIASEFLKVKLRNAGAQAATNAKRLADFLCSTEGDEVLQMQRVHQGETRIDHTQTLPQQVDLPVWSTAEEVDDPELDAYEPQLLGGL